jgi:photosystem II stability/assembly factor-like uncharacterized protein
MRKKYIHLIFLIFLILLNYADAQQGWGSRNPRPQGTIYELNFLNLNTGYGVCDNGLVIKTTTGGNTWVLLRSYTGKNLYSLYFFDINSGYVIGDSGVILYTSNSGNNWIVRNNGITELLKSITFTNPNTGFIAGANGKILKTTNGGLNWIVQSIGSNQLYKVFFLNANTGFIAGSGGLFAKTTNAGVNWQSFSIDTSTLRSVQFTSADTGYIAGSNGIYKTVNGGLNWVNVYILNNRDMYCLNFLNPSTGYSVGKNNPIIKTTNSGENWTWDITSVFEPYIYYHICFIDSVKYISGTDGYILKSDFSQSWITIGGTRHSINSISLTGVDYIVGSAGNQTLFSSNTGLNWRVDTYGQNNFFEPIYTTFKQVYFSNFNNGYRISRSGGGGTGVYWESVSRSTDGGVTWDAPGGWYGGWFTEIYGLTAIENLGFIVGRTIQGGFIMRSISGSNWVTVYSSNSETYYDVSFADVNTGIVRGSSSGQSILRTTNGGANWNQYSIPFWGKIQLLTPEIGLSITNTGTIYRTSNGGINWFIQDTGLGGISTFKFVNSNKGWAVGAHGLILYSSDGGYNWSPQLSNTTVTLNSVSFIDELNGVIGGDSGTVLKTTNGGITFINITSEPIPNSFSLKQNYPNPFNPSTKISFDLPEYSHVILSIYDINGREISTPVNGYLNPGSHEILWNGEGYSSGIYFYKIETKNFIVAKKMILIK